MMAFAVEKVLIGTKLKYEVGDNMFEGTVHCINRKQHIITLENGMIAYLYLHLSIPVIEP